MTDNHQDFVLMQRAIYASMQSTNNRNNSSGVVSAFNYSTTNNNIPKTQNFNRNDRDLNSFRSRSATTRPLQPRKTNSAGPLRNETQKSSYNNQFKMPKAPSKGPQSRTAVAGRMNVLHREGIIPVKPNDESKKSNSVMKRLNAGPVSSKTDIKVGDVSQGALGGQQWEVKIGKQKTKKPTTIGASEFESDEENDNSLLNSSRLNSSLNTSRESVHDPQWYEGWTERIGRGRKSIVCDTTGQRVMVVESSSSSHTYVCICNTTRQDPSTYDLSVQARCNKPTDGQLFGVVLDFKNPKKYQYLSVTMNTNQKYWKIERISTGSTQNLAQAIDRSLITGKSVDILIKVRKDKISLVSNGRDIFTDFACASTPNDVLDGEVGVGVYQTNAVVRFWSIDSVNEPINRPGSAAVEKPLPSGVDFALADMIKRDIIQEDLQIKWEDIAELGTAKKLLKEAVILPMLIPEFFTGLRKPWGGVLLFGPPGTGKTMLAKAVASQGKTTFFNCSASTLVSKWHGESERLVKCLFQMARHYAPSTIFMDEIDALMMSRGSGNEHEASRRLKSELLSQIDGINSGASNGLVMVLATTNKPWEIDEAMRRRLEKRIYIPLPDQTAREAMFQLFLKDVDMSDEITIEEIAKKSEGYSGADIHLLCRDASMRPLRREISDKSPDEIMEMKNQGGLHFKLQKHDFEEAFECIQPSVNTKEMQRYQDWMDEFGSA